MFLGTSKRTSVGTLATNRVKWRSCGQSSYDPHKAQRLNDRPRGECSSAQKGSVESLPQLRTHDRLLAADAATYLPNSSDPGLIFGLSQMASNVGEPIGQARFNAALGYCQDSPNKCLAHFYIHIVIIRIVGCMLMRSCEQVIKTWPTIRCHAREACYAATSKCSESPIWPPFCIFAISIYTWEPI